MAEPPRTQDYVPPDYIIETQTDPEGIQTMAQELIPPFIVRGYLISASVMLACALLLTGVDLYFNGRIHASSVAIAACALEILFLRQWMIQRLAKTQIQRLEERYGTDTILCQLVFWPQGVVVNDDLTGDHLALRYGEIRRIVRRGDYLVLCSYAGRKTIVRLEDVVDRPDFLPYLLKKCAKARKKGFTRSEKEQGR